MNQRVNRAMVWMVSVGLLAGGAATSLDARAHAATQPDAPPRTAPDAAPQAAPSDGEAGAWNVKIIDETWKDEARNRTIPVRIYLPQSKAGAGGDEKLPVIVFSHGLGGSGQNYGYFGNHLASHGYIVLAPTHPGSDTDQAREWIAAHGSLLAIPKPKDDNNEPARDRPLDRVRERLKEQRDGEPEKGPEAGAGMTPGMIGEGGWMMTTINQPENLRNRPRDISFVLDHAAKHEILGPIVDMQRIGVAGHSFGAYTAMAVAGMTVDLPADEGGKARSFRDPRVKAVLPMSPQGAGTMGIAPGAWSKFDAPALFLTGTSDYGVGARSAAWRREGYENSTAVDRALVTITGAGHMTFANPGEKSLQQAANRLGVGLLLLGQNDARQQGAHIALIDSLSTMFFDAYVREDGAARTRFQAFCMSKRSDCVAEFTPGAREKPEARQPERP